MINDVMVVTAAVGDDVMAEKLYTVVMLCDGIVVGVSWLWWIVMLL